MSEVMMNAVERAPFSQMGLYCWRGYAKFIGPVFQRLCHAIRSKKNVCAHVSVLLKLCRPSNVSGLIISIVFDSVKRVAGRPFADLSKYIVPKPFKVVNPWLIHGNSAPTVILKRLIRFAKRAPLDSSPKVKNPRFGHSVCLGNCPEVVLGKAAARSGIPGFQVCAPYLFLFSAFAAAQEVNLASLLWEHTYNRQSVEFFAGNVISESPSTEGLPILEVHVTNVARVGL